MLATASAALLLLLLQGAAEGWRAVRDWVAPGGSLNLNFLEDHFGGAQVTATDASRCGCLAGWLADCCALLNACGGAACSLLPAPLVV